MNGIVFFSLQYTEIQFTLLEQKKNKQTIGSSLFHRIHSNLAYLRKQNLVDLFYRMIMENWFSDSVEIGEILVSISNVIQRDDWRGISKLFCYSGRVNW